MSRHEDRFDTLEEAEDALRESQKNILNAKRTDQKSPDDYDDRPENNIYPDNDKKRFVIAGLVLIAVLSVIAVTVNINKKRNEAERASVEASFAESVSAESESAAEAETGGEAENSFAECDISEINELADEYFAARLSADSETIYRLFGRSDTSANEAYEKKLKAQASWIQGFNDIKVYIADGLTGDEKLCLVTYVIDFRRTDAMAPGIMYFFAKKSDDGTYTIEENTVKEKLEYAKKLTDTGFAKELINETDTELKAALDSNSNLALIYTSFLNGEIYKESKLDVDADQDVDVFMDPQDSVLVDSDTLKTIEEEASEAASIEASEGADDVYETDTDDADEAGSETAAESGE